MDSENKAQPLDIELNEDIAEGIYSNLAIITHSNAEFVVDFVRVLPGVPKAKVRSRIILSPFHAKRLLLALSDNIRKYEENFGEIDAGLDQGIPVPMNFGGPTGLA
jgi:hypothetical protein